MIPWGGVMEERFKCRRISGYNAFFGTVEIDDEHVSVHGSCTNMARLSEALLQFETMSDEIRRRMAVVDGGVRNGDNCHHDNEPICIESGVV